VVEVVDLDPERGHYLLADGRWVRGSDLEDPLWDGIRRDLWRGAKRSARRAAISQGDFAGAFPWLVEARRRRTLGRRGLHVFLWIVAVGLALLVGYLHG